MLRGALAVLVAVLLVAVPTSSGASAGAPGTWAQVTKGDRRSTDDVGLARTKDGVLHVLWERREGRSSTGIAHTTIGKGGKPGRTTAVVTAAQAVDNPAVLVLPDGRLQAFFAALGSSVPQGGVTGAVAPASGVGWKKQGVRSSSTTSAVGPVGAALTADGTPAFAYSASFRLAVHIGTDAGDADLALSPSKQCCDYVPELATDAETGQTILAWYSNAKGRPGTWTRQVAPSVGKPRLAPRSVAGGKSVGVDQHVALSSRLGAPGVFLGYCSGYPVCTSVLLWRVGAGKPLRVAGSSDAEDVDVTPGPGGRLWVAWHDGRTKQVYATRTNTAATRVGPVVVVPPPAGATAMWKLAGEGSTGALDLLVGATVRGSLQTWHIRVLPRLELVAKKQSTAVTLTVTDAGDPVAGATVKLGARTLKTNAAGVVTAPAPTGAVAATASRVGYQAATITIKG